METVHSDFIMGYGKGQKETNGANGVVNGEERITGKGRGLFGPLGLRLDDGRPVLARKLSKVEEIHVIYPFSIGWNPISSPLLPERSPIE
jgi:hypothetical protein